MTRSKKITLGELARVLGGELVGDKEITVSSIKGAEEAGEGELCFILKKKFEHLLDRTKASGAIVPLQIKKSPIPVIKCKNPNLAFKKCVEVMIGKKETLTGIHESAVINDDVSLGKNVSIGACAVIEKGASIEEGTFIYPNVYVGREVSIGKNSLIYPNVTIRENVKIGSNVIIHSGAVIGADGFGYERTESGHEKIPHIGSVIIEDSVEIGACATIDRAKMANTVIGRGTKIDNLVQIAHNITIGKNCIIAAQCGISGSVTVGDNVIMGGQVGIADHLEIGSNSMLAAQAAIMKSVPPNSIMWGKPARPYKTAKAVYALFDKLPEIYQRLIKAEKKLGIK